MRFFENMVLFSLSLLKFWAQILGPTILQFQKHPDPCNPILKLIVLLVSTSDDFPINIIKQLNISTCRINCRECFPMKSVFPDGYRIGYALAPRPQLIRMSLRGAAAGGIGSWVVPPWERIKTLPNVLKTE